MKSDFFELSNMARKTNLTSRTKKNRQEKERQRQKASEKGSQGTDSKDLGGSAKTANDDVNSILQGPASVLQSPDFQGFMSPRVDSTSESPTRGGKLPGFIKQVIQRLCNMA